MEPRTIRISYDILDVNMCVGKHHSGVGIWYTKGVCVCGGQVGTCTRACLPVVSEPQKDPG